MTDKEWEEYYRYHNRANSINELLEIIKPFIKTAEGIPDNWPAECSLVYILDEDMPIINYHSANHDAGPKIGDYQKLWEWYKKVLTF